MIEAVSIELREVEPRYHVPRSQVWAGSRGRQTGNVHLHVSEAVKLGRIRRIRGASLCGKRGWYERPPDPERTDAVCPRCAKIAARYGVVWPNTMAGAS